MKTTETKIKSSTVFDGKIIKVCVDQIKLPNGQISYREEVHHSGGACILAIDKDEIVLVSQFRYAFGKELLEVPAGKLNEGENPQTACERELIEETGLKALDIIKLAEVYPSPGYTDEIIYIYMATKFENCSQNLDDGEFLNVCRMKIEDFLKLVDNGEIHDAKTLISALYLKQYLKQ